MEAIDLVNGDVGRPSKRARRAPVVDIVEDDEVVAVEPSAALARHVKKALARLEADRPDLTQPAILAILNTYVAANPQVKSVPVLVAAVMALLGDQPDAAAADDDDLHVLTAANALDEVLAIFPDAKVSYVQALLETHEDAVAVIEVMAEKGYDKEPRPAPSASAGASSGSSGDRDYSSESAEVSAAYRAQAAGELARNFPFLRVSGIDKLFAQHKQHYYPTLLALEKATGMPAVLLRQGEGHRGTKRSRGATQAYSKAALDELAAKLTASGCALQVMGTVRTSSAVDLLTDPALLEEVQWLHAKRCEEALRSDEQMAQELNEQLASAEGMLLECGCCYDTVPFERIVQCSDGHLFCRACLQHYAEQTVFGNGRSVLKCMNTEGSGCAGFFPESMLRMALPAKVWEKYNEAAARDALKAAGIDDLVVCFACALSVELGAEAGSVLHCPQCSKDTCRLCKEEAHIPLKCSEVEKKKDTSNRLTVEEAMTQARIRECPNGKCKQRFFKVEGCNKMTCTCGALVCYVCRADISRTGYQHFCQVPLCTHADCGKCRLFTNSAEDDRQAMYEAGLKTIDQLRAQGAEGENEGVQGKDKDKEERVRPADLLSKLLEGGLPPAQGQAQGAAVGMPGGPPAGNLRMMGMPMGMPVGVGFPQFGVMPMPMPPVYRAPPRRRARGGGGGRGRRGWRRDDYD